METMFPPFLLNEVRYFSSQVVLLSECQSQMEAGTERLDRDDSIIGGLRAGNRRQGPQAATCRTSRCYEASDWSGLSETPPAIGCREVSLVAGAELAQFENRTLLVYLLLLQGPIPVIDP